MSRPAVNMSPVREIALVVQRELIRNLRSAKGLVLALLCVLGGVGFTLAAIAGRQSVKGVDESELRLVREQALKAIYNADVAKFLADAPEVMLGMMSGTVALSAALATMVGFDAIASEIQHRGVRYWTVRSRRSSYVAGKFFGLFGAVSAMTLLMHVSSWIAIVAKSDITINVVSTWGLRLWVTTLPVSAAWCGLVTFFSSMFRTPILALLVSFAAWMGLGLTYLFATLAQRDALTYVYPNGFDHFLLSPQPNQWLTGAGACFAFGAVFVAATVVLFQQRDV